MGDINEASQNEVNFSYSKEEMEEKMSFVESLFVKYGAAALDINAKNREKFGQRGIYMYRGMYYRVDSLKFEEDQDPYIVISCTDEDKYADVGLMEDVNAFGFDLSEEELEKEVRYALEIEPYPEGYMENGNK